MIYTHLKIVFGKVQKQFCPNNVLGVYCPGVTARLNDMSGRQPRFGFFRKPKTKPVLVYLHYPLWYHF